MTIRSYDQLDMMQVDALREVATIGSGNAATALSGLIGKPVSITLPKAVILAFDNVVDLMGGPEEIAAGILVKMSGDIDGVMLYLQDINFIKTVLDSVLHEPIESYEQLDEMSISALVEIGNIIISSYTTALSTLTELDVSLSVPSMCVNMAGGILSEPLAAFGYETDSVMVLDGSFICDGQAVSSKLFMIPDFKSLNVILEKLGVESGQRN